MCNLCPRFFCYLCGRFIPLTNRGAWSDAYHRGRDRPAKQPRASGRRGARSSEFASQRAAGRQRGLHPDAPFADSNRFTPRPRNAPSSSGYPFGCIEGLLFAVTLNMNFVSYPSNHQLNRLYSKNVLAEGANLKKSKWFFFESGLAY